MSATIGTHSGAFQADEALGVHLLRLLPAYKNAPVTRSRALETLPPLPQDGPHVTPSSFNTGYQPVNAWTCEKACEHNLGAK